MLKSIEIDIDVNRAIENSRVIFEESPNAILRRMLGIDPRASPKRLAPRSRTPRSSGAYSTLVGNKPIEANSLKELLRLVVLLCAKKRTGFLEALSEESTRRGRHIIARAPGKLYPNAPHLIEFAERLTAGWWYDGNIGRNQLAAYFKVIGRLAGLPNIPAISKRYEKTAMTAEDFGL